MLSNEIHADESEWETLFSQEEMDQVALFNALNLDQTEQERLTQIWQQVAPEKSLNEFCKGLVTGGAAITLHMQ